MLVQRVLYNRETRYISLIIFIYIMRKLLSHYVCETCIIDNTWCCKLLFPQHVIYTFHPSVIPLSPMFTNPYHKAIKLFACVFHFKHHPWSAPACRSAHGARLRSDQRALVKMGHQVCAGEHGLQGASVQELDSPKEDLLSWVWS